METDDSWARDVAPTFLVNRTDGKMEDAQTGDSGTDSDAVSQLDSVKDSVSEPSGEKEAVSQESAYFPFPED